eukprot:9717495-Heterocapsa_arctica.AAC.1
MGQEAALRLPEGPQLVHAFFREKGQQRFALDAAEVMQGRYGLNTLGDMCDRLAVAMEDYLGAPGNSKTDTE